MGRGHRHGHGHGKRGCELRGGASVLGLVLAITGGVYLVAVAIVAAVA